MHVPGTGRKTVKSGAVSQMEILDLMTRAREGQATRRLGSHFKLNKNQLAAILAHVVPYLDDALTRLMATPEGLAAILAQLSSGQYEKDMASRDIFENSRILANGTGVLSLLLHNEATIMVISHIAAEGAKTDVRIIRRMMPFIATIYISALAKRSSEPLQQLANHFSNITPLRSQIGNHGTFGLAELVLSSSRKRNIRQRRKDKGGSIKDIINTLSKIEREEEAERGGFAPVPGPIK